MKKSPKIMQRVHLRLLHTKELHDSSQVNFCLLERVPIEPNLQRGVRWPEDRRSEIGFEKMPESGMPDVFSYDLNFGIKTAQTEPNLRRSISRFCKLMQTFKFSLIWLVGNKVRGKAAAIAPWYHLHL